MLGTGPVLLQEVIIEVIRHAFAVFADRHHKISLVRRSSGVELHEWPLFLLSWGTVRPTDRRIVSVSAVVCTEVAVILWDRLISDEEIFDRRGTTRIVVDVHSIPSFRSVSKAVVAVVIIVVKREYIVPEEGRIIRRKAIFAERKVLEGVRDLLFFDTFEIWYELL